MSGVDRAYEQLVAAREDKRAADADLKTELLGQNRPDVVQVLKESRDAANRQLDEAQAALREAQAALREAQAALREAQAAHALAQARQEKAVITARLDAERAKGKTADERERARLEAALLEAEAGVKRAQQTYDKAVAARAGPAAAASVPLAKREQGQEEKEEGRPSAKKSRSGTGHDGSKFCRDTVFLSSNSGVKVITCPFEEARSELLPDTFSRDYVTSFKIGDGPRGSTMLGVDGGEVMHVLPKEQNLTDQRQELVEVLRQTREAYRALVGLDGKPPVRPWQDLHRLFQSNMSPAVNLLPASVIYHRFFDSGRITLRWAGQEENGRDFYYVEPTQAYVKGVVNAVDDHLFEVEKDAAGIRINWTLRPPDQRIVRPNKYRDGPPVEVVLAYIECFERRMTERFLDKHWEKVVHTCPECGKGDLGQGRRRFWCPVEERFVHENAGECMIKHLARCSDIGKVTKEQSKTPDRRGSWEPPASALDTKAIDEVVDAVLAGKKAE